MWVLLIASMLTSYDVPRRTRLPRLPASRYQPPPLDDTVAPLRLTLDGWGFYAKSGGLVVAMGQTTNAFIYGCDTQWDGATTFCKVGRNTLKMPGNAFLLLGMSFATVQDMMRRMQTGRPREAFGVRAIVRALPLINFGLLDSGAYGNLLFSL